MLVNTLTQLGERDIGLIRFLKEHLAAKIFISTLLLLIALSVFVCGLIRIAMPASYSLEMEKGMSREVETLIEQFKNLTFEEAKSKLRIFCNDYNAIVTFYDSDNQVIAWDETIQVMPAPNAGFAESTSVTKTYHVQFKDQDAPYTMNVLGNKARLNLPMLALQRMLPWIAGIVFCISVLVAWIYARYVTKPILRVCTVSKEISKLNLDVYCDNQREDEIGMLAENLNELAERLNIAMTDLREANEKLKREVDQEQKLEQQQLSFFSAVSHELKTPVTILKGQLEGMICGIGGYKDREKYLRRSLEVAKNMQGMIQEILSVSHLKASGFQLNKKQASIYDMVQCVWREQEEIAVDKNLSVDIQIAREDFIMADEKLFKKVLSNLLSNAIRYTPPDGKIWIRAERRQGGGIEIRFENEGELIQEEEIPKLFEPFYRRDPSRNRNTGGSGLGLYIVKTILEDHHYDYKLESTQHTVCFVILCK